ncbi:hypothetical protein ABZ470_31620 [Streptosporangium sp. NPDC020072]|uniref:hypothetical protein n=1 Tax=Streptosporangium sp. NPDC020072 TaxID=3154788 RepID=UPI003428E3B4
MKATSTMESLFRAVANASEWAAKTGTLSRVRLDCWSQRVTVLATDSVAMCLTSAPAETTEARHTWLEITRPDLEALTKAVKPGATKESKEAQVSLNFVPEEGLHVQTGTDDFTFKDIYREGEADPLGGLMGYFTEWRTEQVSYPMGVMLSATYLARLNRMRKEAPDIGAHIIVPDPAEPVLIKLGRYTRVVIQPIDPVRHVKAFGGGVLWD